jgi:NCS1 family nucleobase:cation symporter-1
VSAERAPRPNLADLPSAIGNIIIAAAITLNGAIGSRHHIPFSIAARASLGFYFSYFAVVSRLVLGLLYFG